MTAARAPIARRAGEKGTGVNTRWYCLCLDEVRPELQAWNDHVNARPKVSHVRIGYRRWLELCRDDGAEAAYAEHTNPY